MQGQRNSTIFCFVVGCGFTGIRGGFSFVGRNFGTRVFLTQEFYVARKIRMQMSLVVPEKALIRRTNPGQRDDRQDTKIRRITMNGV